MRERTGWTWFNHTNRPFFHSFLTRPGVSFAIKCLTSYLPILALWVLTSSPKRQFENLFHFFKKKFLQNHSFCDYLETVIFIPSLHLLKYFFLNYRTHWTIATPKAVSPVYLNWLFIWFVYLDCLSLLMFISPVTCWSFHGTCFQCSYSCSLLISGFNCQQIYSLCRTFRGNASIVSWKYLEPTDLRSVLL